ncbi:MAG: glycosyltransferase family 39 protein [Leptolyngbya sp. SIO1E4]|nr:glycosyltransferase family 39 protein [Leptolyngbya sp. SIO1E4]
MNAEHNPQPDRESHKRLLIRLIPYIGLLIWTLPLLILNSSQQSLMAFDEVHYASRARLMIESENWINPWLEPHHKTPGYYWLVAASFKVFGMTENAARFPNLVSGLLATFILYEIGKLLFNNRVGFLAALILSTQFIWTQYSRLSAPDIPMVLLVLLGILSLLKAESSAQKRSWHFLAGISLGLGFFVRSYVSFLPIIALLPYLVLNNRRHRHLNDWALYLGVLFGFSPTVLWLLLEWTQYQVLSFQRLFDFTVSLTTKDRHGGGWHYYLWNVPLNAFPWSLFALAGMGLVWQKTTFRYRMLCLGYPLLLLLQISVVGTRTPRYSLGLYPFLALHAGVSLEWLRQRYFQKEASGKRVIQGLSYGFSGLGIILIGLSFMRSPIVAAIPDAEEYLSDRVMYAVFLLGLAWLGAAVIFHFRKDWSGAQYWLATLLMGPWLFLALFSSSGLLSNYNAEIKSFVEREDVTQILQNNSVHFIWVDKEFANKRLLNFYTPHIGQYYDDFQQFDQSGYVWAKVEPENSALIEQCQAIGDVRGWKLVYVVDTCNQPR